MPYQQQAGCSMTVIEMRGVSKRFGRAQAVQGVSLQVQQGALLALVGPSGCGKTTLLRLIAGLETPDEGEVWLNGARVALGGSLNDWQPPERRRVGMVFQDYALFPHMTAAHNIEFPLDKWRAPERADRVREMLQLVGLVDKGTRYPHQLSGGEQQRVALARALAARPSLVLLDEPFSNLDAALRKEMREDVRDILRAANATAVFVTHDQEEALSIADQVAVMQGGQILQLDTAQNVYLRPASRAVAAFIGETNFLSATVGDGFAHSPLGIVPLSHARADVPNESAITIMIRPEALVLRSDPQAHGVGAATVRAVRFYGYDQMVQVQMDDGMLLKVRAWARPTFAIGARVRVAVRGEVMMV
jgi:iron(III) transport system ATP-binding protein